MVLVALASSSSADDLPKFFSSMKGTNASFLDRRSPFQYRVSLLLSPLLLVTTLLDLVESGSIVQRLILRMRSLAQACK